MFNKQKIEVIPFKDFMSRPAAPILKKTPLQLNVFSFFPPITVTSFFPVADPGFSLFLLGVGVIGFIALSETAFASGGMTGIASTISSVFKIVFPVTGFGLIFWFLSTL